MVKRVYLFFGNSNIINILNEKFENQNIYKNSFSMKLYGENNKKEKIFLLEKVLENNILRYNRLFDKKDVYNNDKPLIDFPGIKVNEVFNPKIFDDVIKFAKKVNKKDNINYEFDVDKFNEERMFLINLGSAGLTLDKYGFIANFFKNDKMVTDVDLDKVISSILLTGIKNGGNKIKVSLNANLYNFMKVGFMPVCSSNDVIYFKHNGKKINQIVNDIANNTWKKYDTDGMKTFENLDDADEYFENNVLDDFEKEY